MPDLRCGSGGGSAASRERPSPLKCSARQPNDAAVAASVERCSKGASLAIELPPGIAGRKFETSLRIETACSPAGRGRAARRLVTQVISCTVSYRLTGTARLHSPMRKCASHVDCRAAFEPLRFGFSRAKGAAAAEGRAGGDCPGKQ